MRKGMLKNYQKQFTKLLRRMNKQIEDDDWFLGRYYVMQRATYFYRFDDGSGGIMGVILRFYDRETGYYWDTHMEYAPYLVTSYSRLALKMNEFITEKAWDGQRHHKSITNWIGVPKMIDDNRDDNFYISYKYFFGDKNGTQ